MPELLLGDRGREWKAEGRLFIHTQSRDHRPSPAVFLSATMQGSQGTTCPIATGQLRCKTFHSGPDAVSHRVPVPIPVSQERKRRLEKLRKRAGGHRRSKWRNQVHSLWCPDESHDPFVSQLSMHYLGSMHSCNKL